jgi:drug/metabolite transporter (DMT)-like permease
VAVVGLALLSAFLFAAMNVTLRVGLGRYRDPALASLVTVVAALAVTLVAAAAEAPARGIHLGGAWPFALTGLLQPGLGQLLVVLAIAEAGASRASIVFGAGPLVSVTIALVLLGEPLSAPLLAGAVLIVAGGVELARERQRPSHVRVIGLVYAFLVTVFFSIRDNLLRWLSESASTPPAVAATATLLAGLAVLTVALATRVRRRPRLREAAPFVLAGLVFGASYVSLFEAFYRGRVTIVSPLVATESLWAVALSLLLIRRSEHIQPRLVAGALLVVAGGVVIGVFR